MKVRVVAALVVVGAVLGVARAQDAWRWDPKVKKAPPKAGDRYFEEVTEKQTLKLHMSAGEKVLRDQNDVSSLDWRAAIEIVSVEGDDVTKRIVKFERWERTKGDKADKSLEGKTVTVEGVGETAKVTIEPAEPAVSKEAKDWVKKELAKAAKKHDPESVEPQYPKEPVADGGEWHPDPKELAREMFKGAEIDAEQSSATGKLSKVRAVKDGHVGLVEIKAKLQLKQFPGAPIPITEGGAAEIDARAEEELDSRAIHDTNATITMTFKAKGQMKNPQDGSAIDVSMDMEMRKTGKAGDLQ